MFKRILGLVMIVTALLGIVISIGIAVYGRQAVDDAGQQVDDILGTATEGLGTAEESLRLAKTAVSDVNTTLETVEGTAVDLARTITDTQPLLDQIGIIATERVPDSLEAVEESIPSITAVAGTVDRTLRTLSRFGFERDFGMLDLGPLGVFPLGTIDFDLGVNYDPEQPFDESVRTLGESIEGLPEELRSLETYLETTSSNLALISRDIDTLSQDISALNGTLSETPELLDQYLATLTNVQNNLRQTRRQIDGQIETLQLVVLIFAIWFGLLQLVPLYLGWELFSGRRATSEKEEIDPIPIIHEDDAATEEKDE